ncbi:BTA121 domain-containing protein surface lipoprotein [Borrelia hermsii]|uniref:Uncharacterized protein n=2 Tax=Borrelia hermsii TaxID=140 RepID=S4VN23_BORHE|nr:hypothetical protein [Borrelia hermsii]AGO68851.1 hypothetical protein BHA160 [Borrelia hermsii]AMR75996.1 hypothetical protein A0V01_05120 [Borrelia hermsii]ANA43800.1 Mrl-type protein [Borrelia hermsii HS1]UPA08594.1 hypothetical protein bhDAH_001307 [Borrelia hermsii DAH]
MKIRHHDNNLLLVLILLLPLLLIISCNLKPKEDAVLKGSLFVKNALLVGAPSLRKLSKTDDKIGEVIVHGVGVSSEKLSKAEDKISAIAHGVEVAPGTGADESTEVKINKLLDEFGLSDPEKEAVWYIQNILTDSKINGYFADSRSLFWNDVFEAMPNMDDKKCITYTAPQFYNLLVSLGDARLKEIIGFHLEALRRRDDTLSAISGIIKDETARQRLSFILGKVMQYYPSYLKWVCGRSDPDEVYHQAKARLSNLSDFTEIKDEAINLAKLEQKLLDAGVLSNEEWELIGCMRGAMNNLAVGMPPSAGRARYHGIHFDKALDKLSINDELKVLLGYFLFNFVALKESKIAIDAIEDSASKRKLKNRFEARNKFYLGKLKEMGYIYLWGSRDDFEEILVSGYDTTEMINDIREKANEIVCSEKLYSALPTEEWELLEYARKVVIDPDIGRDKGYKTYSNFKFYEVLLRAGYDNLRKLIGNDLSLFRLIKEIEGLITEENRDLFEDVFNNIKHDHSLAIKHLFEGYFKDKGQWAPNSILDFNNEYIGKRFMRLKQFINLVNESRARRAARMQRQA